ncbi:Hypothetical predicted protein, partial [Pelobates cultripes]
MTLLDRDSRVSILRSSGVDRTYSSGLGRQESREKTEPKWNPGSDWTSERQGKPRGPGKERGEANGTSVSQATLRNERDRW